MLFQSAVYDRDPNCLPRKSESFILVANSSSYAIKSRLHESAPAYMNQRVVRLGFLLLARISRLQHDLHVAFLVQLHGLRQVNSCERNLLLLTVF